MTGQTVNGGPRPGTDVRRQAVPLQAGAAEPSDGVAPARETPQRAFTLTHVQPPPPQPPSNGRKIAFVCIDGFGYELCKQLRYPSGHAVIDARVMPNMSRLLNQEGYKLQKFFPGIPSTTPASMLGFTLGDNSRVPAYYWYDKATGTHHSAAEFKDFEAGYEASARARGNPGLVAKGSLQSCLASGGTPDSHYSIDVMSQKFQQGGTAAVLGYVLPDLGRLLVRHPLRFGRMLERTAADTGRNFKDSFNGRNGDFEPGQSVVSRLGSSLEQSIETATVSEAGTAGVLDDMKKGSPAIFIDIASYDGTAHAYGPFSPQAAKALSHVDRNVGAIMDQAKKSGYEVVFLSDHGQTNSVTFESQYGQSAGQWVQSLARQSVPGEKVAEGLSGALDNIYFTSTKHQLQLDEVQQRYPGMLDKLVAHPAVDMVVTRQGNATWVFGQGGHVRIQGDQVQIFGRDILAGRQASENTIADQLNHLGQMPNSGDVILLGKYLGDQRSLSFETQPGGHGGLGGNQNESIFITEPGRAIDTSRISNSSQMYGVLRSMLPAEARAEPAA